MNVSLADDAAWPEGIVENGLRVLVVDDNRQSAMTLKWAIEGWGDEVVACYDGPTALQIAREFRPDVILLDIGMPGMDGIAVCQGLRAAPETRSVKIIAQTGWGDDAMRRKTAEAGFDLHLVKPVNFDVLGDMLALLRMLPKSA
ncbi:response regulator [Asticcacaulis sp. SL142]|uniref:response regulator n=1 Tax=Asticcacaulis sp. SL142 TaxID=2995155 RepID=UPI00226D3216|nr:response regulator [Asticcacaulis sp. SL142]WAC46833.1 response regulator [Asticcacaulis sp. SL142]